MSQTPFSSLPLLSALQDNLVSLKYLHMTPVQAQSLPLILQGKDVIAQARTGSGKTAAFGLGLLHSLQVKIFKVQSLVLCPTRELADQVAKEIRRLARGIHNIKVLTLCGGTPFGPQIGSLEHGAHIIVGTPGRIEEHLRKGTLKLETLRTLVLDEADRMLDMGFQASMDAIFKHIPEKRQTLLFSATYSTQVKAIASKLMATPQWVETENDHDNNTIEQHFYLIESGVSRLQAIQTLLLHFRPGSALVFCNTKKETQQLADALCQQGFNALALHGDLEQKNRDQTLVRFANNSATVLVATDVAARGIDIEALDAVINYQIARELEVHIHRIGRTGRAGRTGLACTLYSEKETFKYSALEKHLGQPLESYPLPAISLTQQPAYQPPMVTLQIDGGKKQKLRPGDILGALTAQNDISGDSVGKIHRFDHCTYVAIRRKDASAALSKLTHGKLKGRSFRTRRIRG